MFKILLSDVGSVEKKAEWNTEKCVDMSIFLIPTLVQLKKETESDIEKCVDMPIFPILVSTHP